MSESFLYCSKCGLLYSPSSHGVPCPQCGCHRAPESPTGRADVAPIPDDGTSAPAERPAFLTRFIGHEIGGYAFESFLGRGGMGWVFLAKHATLLRHCAVKILCPEHQGRHIDSSDRFLVEARSAAALVHPHIVAVHNVGSLEEHSFIEMEYVPGQTLEQIVVRQSPLSFADATDWLWQACLALAHAHRRGIVHRDFKPGNILIRDDNTAKLADFGLAKRLDEPSTLAGDGLAGTPRFMAPELFAGAPATRASDVYAVGVTYFFLLTGAYPFPGRSLDDFATMEHPRTIPDPRDTRPDIPAEAAALIVRCLANASEDRYPDGDAVQRELRRVLGDLRSLDDLVQAALADLDATAEFGGPRIAVIVRTATGRKQRVFVEEAHDESGHPRKVRVFSVCAAVRESYYRRALELNADLPYGALAIQEVDGEPHFVMLKLFWRALCDPDEIRRCIQEIAVWADHVEEALTGQDRR